MIWKDLRFAIRMLTKRPAFTLVAVLTLGLGIGLNSTVFTFVNAVLLRGLPFEDGHRVMYVKNIDRERGDDFDVSYQDFLAYRDQAQSFKALAASTSGTMNSSDATGVPERLAGTWVTTNTFRLIGEEPILGRDFAPGEDAPGAEPVTLLGHTLWQKRYGGRPDILGEVLRINGIPTTIIGVMPEGMKFPNGTELWAPLSPTEEYEQRDHRNLAVFGRLADDASLAQAQDELAAIGQRLAEQFPNTNRNVEVAVLSYNDEFNGGEIKVLFLALMGAVGFVLLIACANVANLLLARSSSRAREMSVRTAMGAGRGQLVRQLLIESLLLSGLGGLVGLALSFWGVRMFDLATASIDKPYWIDFSIDLKVIAFLATVCVATGICFGLAPALHAARADLQAVLRDGGRGQGGGRRVKRATATLVVVQLALTVALLFGAGLMIKSFQKLRNLDLGIRQDNLLTLRVGLPEVQYPTGEERIAFQDILATNLQGLPGIESVAITSHLPISGSFQWSFERADQPVVDGHERPKVRGLTISPDYFSVLGTAPTKGRAFHAQDGQEGAGTVIVNEAFATAHWGPSNALGQRLRLGEDGEGPWLTVVGVAPAIRQENPNEAEVGPTLYLPYRLDPARFFTLLVRSRTAPQSLTLQVQETVQGIDPDLPVYFVQTMEAYIEQRSWAYRVFGSLFAIFALVALVLSSVGVYAVMTYAVSQRLQEIGVRMAMGAEGGSIVWLVLRGGLGQLLLGFAFGLPAALGLGQVLQGLMIQVSPRDPAILATIAGFLAATGIAACMLPALRAVRVDPVKVLRD